MKNLSYEEFNAVKAELRTRLNIMYGQNSVFLTAALAIWGVAVGILLGIFGQNGTINVYNIISEYFLLLLPAVFAIPLGVKSGDNLTRIAQLAAYLKHFYEKGYMEKLVNGEPCFMYESVLDKVGHSDKISYIKAFNSEYFITVLISLFATIILTIFLAVYTCTTQNIVMLIISLSAGFICLFSLVIIGKIVYVSSSAKHTFFAMQSFYNDKMNEVSEDIDKDVESAKLKAELEKHKKEDKSNEEK